MGDVSGFRVLSDGCDSSWGRDGGCSPRGVSVKGGVASVFVTSTADGMLSSCGCSATISVSAAGRTAGETDFWPFREWVELWALGFELDGMRFFRSLLAGFFSLSIVEVLWNRLERFRSLVGVEASGF